MILLDAALGGRGLISFLITAIVIVALLVILGLLLRKLALPDPWPTILWIAIGLAILVYVLRYVL